MQSTNEAAVTPVVSPTRCSIGLLQVLLAATIGCHQHSSKGGIVLPDDGLKAFRNSWIVLDEPSSDPHLAVGAGYNLHGGYSQDCYTIAGTDSEKKVSGRGWDKIVVGSTVSSHDSAFFHIASIFGVDAFASKATTVWLEVDSVLTIMAANAAPSPECRDLGADGLPNYPAVIGLLGARSFAFHALNSRKKGLVADYVRSGEAASAGLIAKDTSSDSAHFEFTGVRYFGIHLQTFTLAQGNAPITYGPYTLGMGNIAGPIGVYEFRAEETGANLYRVLSHRLVPPGADWAARSDVVTGQSFVPGQPNDKTGGIYQLVTFKAYPPNNYTLTLATTGFAGRTWATEAEKGDLVKVINAPRSAPPSSPLTSAGAACTLVSSISPTLNVRGGDVDVGLSASEGSLVEIQANGQVNFGGAFLGVGAPVLGPDGDDWATPQDYPVPALRKNSLIFRVGAKWYQGGNSTRTIVTSSGPIVLRANDKDIADNSQGWNVTVRVTPSACQ